MTAEKSTCAFARSSRTLVQILCALLLAMGFTTSETLAQSAFRFGLTASPLISWHRPDNPAITSDASRLGFQYGLLMDYNLEETGRYAFATGILVTMNGGTIVDTRDTGYNIIDANRLQYIDIPLTVRLTATELNYFKFYGQIGMTPGVNIRARGDRDINPDRIDIPDQINRKIDGVNLFNIGLEVGGGMVYNISEHLGANVGITYRNGFVNLYRDGDDDKTTLNQVALNLALFF